MTAGALPVVIVAALLAGGQPRETVAAIEVHGNTATSDAEIRSLSGLEVGAPFGPTTIEDTTARLEMTKRFRRVEVLKRYASIADPSQVLVVVIVDEGAVRIEMTNDPSHPTRVVHERNLKLLFAPVLSHDDGYGTAYGVRMTRRDPAGAQSRLSIPLTWGGDKRAALEFNKIFDSVAVGRVLAGASISRRTIPFFEQDHDQARLWVRGERDVQPHLRIGATAAAEHDTFVDERDGLVQIGADMTLDTRVDPVLPRNAVFARVAWDRFAVRPQGGPGNNAYSVNRLDVDARGYVGVFRQNVLAVRAYKTDSDAPLPPYLKPLLGGLENLRGFAAGTAAGDTLVATSAELIVPLTSPLSIGKFGVSALVDAAAIYDKGSFLADQTWKQGYGGGVWFSAAFLRINVVVAHGRGSTTRAHVGANLSF